MTIEELKAETCNLFMAREQAQQQLAGINQQLQIKCNQIAKLEQEEKSGIED